MDAVAFLGSGSMAGAMAEGMIAKGAFSPARMACIGGSGRSAPDLASRTGMRLAASLGALLSGAGTLVVAFKPQNLASADPSLAGLSEGRLVVSVLAGKTLDSLAKVFPRARNIVRSMPNTPSQIGAGITGWCAQKPLAQQDRLVIGGIFGALGASVELPEEKMDAFTAICGCGPAYVFEFAAALRDAGLGLGFDPATSRQFAVETVLGAARLLAKRDVDPEILRSEVTSPNGVTAAGLRRMADLDFRGMIKSAITAARARAQELST